MGRLRDSQNKVELIMNIICITPLLHPHLNGVQEILNSIGFVYYVPYLSKEELKFAISKEPGKYTVIYTNPNEQGFVIDKDILDLGIETVCTASTGTNHIDMKYCEEKGIKVISLTTDYETINNIPATAEHAFALTTSLIRKIPSAMKSAQDYEWNYEPFIGRQLKDLKFGVVGYGRLGKMYHKYASSFSQYDVMICDPYKEEGSSSLEEVFEQCEIGRASCRERV